MIDLPIQSNLYEGLFLIEYIISYYGAHKGIVDTIVWTLDIGYLMHKLVEVDNIKRLTFCFLLLFLFLL